MAFVGRDCLVKFAISDENTAPLSGAYKRLGMLRGKSTSFKWDTVDATADMSPEYTKQTLVTFKMVEFSGDGVAKSEETLYHQKEFKAQVIAPSVSTGNQPKVWLEIVDPDGDVVRGPFIVNEWSDDRPHADVATFKIAAASNGAVTYIPA